MDTQESKSWGVIPMNPIKIKPEDRKLQSEITEAVGDAILNQIRIHKPNATLEEREQYVADYWEGVLQ